MLETEEIYRRCRWPVTVTLAKLLSQQAQEKSKQICPLATRDSQLAREFRPGRRETVPGPALDF